MKVEAWIFAAIGAFLVPLSLWYWLVSDEHAGALLLVLGGVAMLLLASYSVGVMRGRPPRPEDRPDATPDAAAGHVVGVFPGSSIWPLVIALGATIAAYGVAFTAWISAPGLAVALLGIAGYVREASHP